MSARAIAQFSVPGRPISRWAALKRRSRSYQQYRGTVFVRAQKAMRGRRPVSGSAGVQIIYRVDSDKAGADLDNIIKGILDGMKKTVFHDDDQVCGLFVWRAEPSDGQECVEVTVAPWLDGNGVVR